MTKPNQLDEDKKGLVGKVYGVYVDYSTNLCSGEITFKNKEALDYYIAKAQTEARVDLLNKIKVEIWESGNNDNWMSIIDKHSLEELKKKEL